MTEKPTILFIAIIPPGYSPFLATSYGMDRRFDLLPHKLGIMALVAWLRENSCEGHYVWIDSLDEKGLDVIDDAIAMTCPDAIGFSLVTEEMMSHYRLIEILKERYPKIPIIAGGSHVSALPEHTLEHFPKIDYVVVGEGERTLTELLIRIAAGQTHVENKWIMGLATNDGTGNIVVSPPREKISDINLFPDPAYDLIFDPNEPPDKRSAFPLVCSYGCYFFCTFCSVEHGNYRCVTPERVVDRIERAVKKYGVEYFAIRDSFWPPTRQWLDTFCDEIEKRKLNVKFHFQTRAGTLTVEHLERLKKIGAQAIGLGIEAGDPAILKSMRKGITIKMARRAVADLNEVGIFSICFFIFGNLGENRETVQATIDLVLEMNPSIAFFNPLFPLPGAEAFDAVQDDRKNWWMDGEVPSICDMSVEEIVELASDTFLKYPLRWAYLKQHVLGGKLSPEFRSIARRAYLIHLKKYMLGMSERFTPLRFLIHGIKSLRDRGKNG